MKSQTFIHDSAFVDPDAEIGPGCQIWINAQIREHASIGAGCKISKDCYIDSKVVIGERCKIQNSVSIYQGITIGDDVFIGPNACFTNDRVPRAFNDRWTITETKICDGASVGANATILCGVTIGAYAMVAAGSVVTKDVPPFTLVVGAPAKELYKINKEGERVDV